MSDDMLYAKRGKRYLPWGRFYDPGVIQCGTWLVRCTETGTSYYRIDDRGGSRHAESPRGHGQRHECR